MTWQSNANAAHSATYRRSERKSEQKFFIRPIMFMPKSLFNFSCRALRWCVARAEWKQATREKAVECARWLCAARPPLSAAYREMTMVWRYAITILQRVHWLNPFCLVPTTELTELQPKGIRCVNGAQRSFFFTDRWDIWTHTNNFATNSVEWYLYGFNMSLR